MNTYEMTASQAECLAELLATSRRVEIQFEQSSPNLSTWCVSVALKRLRKSAGKLQRECAAALEQGIAVVRRIENGAKKPSVAQLWVMLKFYGVESEDLKMALELLVRKRRHRR